MTATETRDETDSSGQIIPKHLTTRPKSRISPGLVVDPSRGLFYCVECDRRVTQNGENGREYGHDRHCEHHETSGFEPIERWHFYEGGPQ